MQDAQVVNVRGNKISDTTEFRIGDQVIPVTKATIELAVGEFISMTLTVRAGDVDLSVLQDKTHVVIINENTDDTQNDTTSATPDTSGVLNTKVTQPAVS